VATLLQWVTSALNSFLLSDGSSCYQRDDFWQPQLLHILTKTRTSFTSHMYDPCNILQAEFHFRWAWKLNFTTVWGTTRHSYSYAAFNCRNALVHVFHILDTLHANGGHPVITTTDTAPTLFWPTSSNTDWFWDTSLAEITNVSE
jgi:hypothetical protein